MRDLMIALALVCGLAPAFAQATNETDGRAPATPASAAVMPLSTAPEVAPSGAVSIGMPVPGSNVNEHIVVNDNAPGPDHETGNANARAVHPNRSWHRQDRGNHQVPR